MYQSVYMVVNHKGEVVTEMDDFIEARYELHRLSSGSRVIRGDGVVLAFMAKSGSARARKLFSGEVQKRLTYLRRIHHLRRAQKSSKLAK